MLASLSRLGETRVSYNARPSSNSLASASKNVSWAMPSLIFSSLYSEMSDAMARARRMALSGSSIIAMGVSLRCHGVVCRWRYVQWYRRPAASKHRGRIIIQIGHGHGQKAIFFEYRQQIGRRGRPPDARHGWQAGIHRAPDRACRHPWGVENPGCSNARSHRGSRGRCVPHAKSTQVVGGSALQVTLFGASHLFRPGCEESTLGKDHHHANERGPYGRLTPTITTYRPPEHGNDVQAQAAPARANGKRGYPATSCRGRSRPHCAPRRRPNRPKTRPLGGPLIGADTRVNDPGVDIVLATDAGPCKRYSTIVGPHEVHLMAAFEAGYAHRSRGLAAVATVQPI